MKTSLMFLMCGKDLEPLKERVLSEYDDWPWYNLKELTEGFLETAF